MKILMVISEAPPIKSGIARVADRLSKGLASSGHEIEILSLRDVPRWEWGEIRISSMLLKIRAIRNRLHEYDLIHLHGPVPTFSDVFLLGALSRQRPPLVYTHHAPIDLRHFPFKLLAPPYNAVQERLARLADHVVVTTPTYGQHLSRHVPPEKLSVIPWGVDYDHFAAPIIQKEDPFTVLFLGQIRPYKGLPVLLNAFHGIDDAHLWIVGDGHRARANRRLAQELGLRNVTFWGRLPDAEMIERLHQAHVLVLPSVTRSEAFGLALLEGMAAGCVPVASHLPGVADVVGNEGFTFPAGNQHALHEILTRLANDKTLRQHHAELAQARARLYPWERVVFGYERIIKQLTAHACARGQSVVSSPALNGHVNSYGAVRRARQLVNSAGSESRS
ncbi:MAG TPA: glycosyltransferase family 4 protein [Candidatus Sulfomarinibacteraceae bacterium]|nr:glycosyltransferase family 4 protein [Candidatus Sulfomarinibacteraceae bacterium]